MSSNQITFSEARRAAEAKHSAGSLASGMEDALDFNVLMSPPLYDEVVLVNKATGDVHEEIYFDVEPRLSLMTKVTDSSAR